jgi:hypothetical protein
VLSREGGDETSLSYGVQLFLSVSLDSTGVLDMIHVLKIKYCANKQTINRVFLDREVSRKLG